MATRERRPAALATSALALLTAGCSLGYLSYHEVERDLDVIVQPGGTRYRNEQQEQKLKTDAKGELSVTWPNPGMYWLESTLQDQKTSVKQAKQRRVSYVATFEVLPQ